MNLLLNTDQVKFNKKFNISIEITVSVKHKEFGKQCKEESKLCH